MAQERREGKSAGCLERDERSEGTLAEIENLPIFACLREGRRSRSQVQEADGGTKRFLHQKLSTLWSF